MSGRLLNFLHFHSFKQSILNILRSCPENVCEEQHDTHQGQRGGKPAQHIQQHDAGVSLQCRTVARHQIQKDQ